MLHYAARGHNLDLLKHVVRVYLSHRSSLDTPNHKGNTPLLLAAYQGNDEAMKELYATGASPLLLNENQDTALHLACWKGHVGVTEFLLQEFTSKKQPSPSLSHSEMKQEESKQHTATEKKNGEKIDINARNLNGDTALHWAIYNGHTQVVEQLVQSGANLSIVNGKGVPLLHWALKNGDVELMKVLLTNGANVNSQSDSNQDTVLHRAAYKGQIDVVKLLLEHGASTSIPDMVSIAV